MTIPLRDWSVKKFIFCGDDYEVRWDASRSDAGIEWRAPRLPWAKDWQSTPYQTADITRALTPEKMVKDYLKG